MELKLTDSIEKLKGVGAKRAALYQKLGIDTIYSILTFYPHSYIYLDEYTQISKTLLDDVNVIKATVFKKQGAQCLRSGLTMFKVFVSDESGSLCITIFNSQYMFDSLKDSQEYYFYGKVTGNLLKREMLSPFFISVEEKDLVRPTYGLTNGLSNSMVQGNIKDALAVWGDRLIDYIPNEICKENQLCKLRYAMENIHFPTDKEALLISQKRLIFEELLILQLGMQLLRNKSRKKTEVKITDCNLDEFYKALPFTLTNGQASAINDGLSDLTKDVPMNRLLQGDVGSGKTMVAAALCYACAKNGYQSAVMAPTQVLAEQHYETFTKLLTPLGISCCLITGSQTAKQRTSLLNGIKNGEYSVILGTHALVQSSVEFKELGFVVTDEQHRFGVSQRATLKSKGENPHMLVMSATPIPRTLALIIYGDLDISVIEELPSGRIPIDTLFISTSKRGRALGFIKKEIDNGRQAYIICPLIDENESDLVSIAEYIKGLSISPLADYKIGCLHGRLKAKQKQELMSSFKANEIQILVSTTVVEVGIDVANATVIMIENAERFGLSQMHQLRGRVGRGEFKSYCILVSDNQGEENKKRIEIMKSSGNGFDIANEDLKLRGPGDFFGLRQHGLPELKLADFYKDIDVMLKTQALAKDILQEDNDLSSAINRGLRHMVRKLFSNNEQVTLN